MNQTDFTLNDCRINLRRSGTGPAMLMLHGAGGAASLVPVADALSARFDVLLPDHPAFGDSDEAEGIASVSDLAYFYLDLLETLDLRDVHVVGHSMGGWLACEMAVRCTARIRSLALIAPVGIYVKGRPFGDLFLMSPEELTRNLFENEAARAAALAYEPSEAELEIMVKNRFAAARYGWHPRLHNPDLAKWLHRIKVPTLLLWGAEDRIVPAAYADAFKGLIPNAEAHVFETCGHLPFVDRKSAFFARLDDFLGRQAA